MRLVRRTLALAAGAVAVAIAVASAAAGVGADEAPSPEPPIAALLPALNFSPTSMGSTDASAPAPATVSPSSAVVADDVDTARSTPPPPPPVRRESPFSLVHSASSNDAVDLLEIVRTNMTDAPRISFESMTNKRAWDVEKWDDPLTLLANMIANEHINVSADNVRLAVQLQDPVTAASIAFTKTSAWELGPTLVLGDRALDGLTKIKHLEFSNFNVSFEGSKWLPPDTTLKSLIFNKSTIASFSIPKDSTVLRTTFRDSKLASFPTAVLQQSIFAEALTIESCTFLEPLKLSAADLSTLQNLPSVTLARNTFPPANTSDCAETALYEGLTVCVTTTSAHSTLVDPTPPLASPTPSPSPETDDLETPSPLSDASLESSRSMLHMLFGLIAVVGIVAVIAGLVWRRRRTTDSSRTHENEAFTVSNHSDKFIEHADPSDDDLEQGSVSDARSSQRTTAVGMGVFSDVDLGRHAVTGESRLGANGLWRADYRGETVAALCVNVESLRDRGREIDAVVASCVALRHPHVVEFVGTSLAATDDMWLVTAFMAKGSLRSVMVKKKFALTWPVIHRLSRELASAVAYVQSMRDATTRVTPTLSSRSVLFDSDFTCKLDVLECAQSTRDHERPVHSYGQGDIVFRAPELLQSGNASQLSTTEAAAAEVFALGVILCEMTVQAPLYNDIMDARGLTGGELWIAREVAAGRLRPAPAADTPEVFARLVDACVAFEPEDRPSIDEIVHRLTNMAM